MKKQPDVFLKKRNPLSNLLCSFLQKCGIKHREGRTKKVYVFMRITFSESTPPPPHTHTNFKFYGLYRTQYYYMDCTSGTIKLSKMNHNKPLYATHTCLCNDFDPDFVQLFYLHSSKMHRGSINSTKSHTYKEWNHTNKTIEYPTKSNTDTCLTYGENLTVTEKMGLAKKGRKKWKKNVTSLFGSKKISTPLLRV